MTVRLGSISASTIERAPCDSCFMFPIEVIPTWMGKEKTNMIRNINLYLLDSLHENGPSFTKDIQSSKYARDTVA